MNFKDTVFWVFMESTPLLFWVPGEGVGGNFWGFV